MKPTDLLRAALQKTAANLRPNVAPVKASSSYAPTPAIRPPSLGAKAKMFNAPPPPPPPTKPSTSATQAMDMNVPPVLTPPTRGTRATAHDVRQFADETPLRHAYPVPSRTSELSMADLLKNLGVPEAPKAPVAPVKPSLLSRASSGLQEGKARLGAALNKLPGGRTPWTAGAGSVGGGVAGGSLVAAGAPGPQAPAPVAAPTPAEPAPAPVAAPEAEPALMPDVPRGPRYDPLEGMPA